MNPFTEKIGLKAFKLWLQTKQNYLILIFRKTESTAARQCADEVPLPEQNWLSFSNMKLLMGTVTPMQGSFPTSLTTRFRAGRRKDFPHVFGVSGFWCS